MKKMKRMKRIGGCLFTLLLAMVVCLLFIEPVSLRASNTAETLTGNLYTLDESSEYNLSDETATVTAITASNAWGTCSITGDYTNQGTKNGYPFYKVNSGNIDISYMVKSSSYNKSDDEWHVCNDNGKRVDGIELDNSIKKGVVLILSSLDGNNWVLDQEYSDFFTLKNTVVDTLASTNDVQLQNGCYYKVIVARKIEKIQETGQILFIMTKDKEYQEEVELYTFYAEGDITGASSSADQPRKRMGDVVATGKDSGYSGSSDIELKDPHYGWTIGEFFVNGYTEDTVDSEGNPVFLKNVGDKVTLWFKLTQDINKLNGNENLSIAVDKNGYDKYFQIEKTNMKHGTLIIQFTDYEGVKHDPVVFTDYLAACTRTGTDTKVLLFEEGDYEVSLDYEIKNCPRQVGNVEVAPTYTNYKIFFKYSIRNSNCMVFPFDISTGKELIDGERTENGFRLDMARSRYLTINLKKEAVSADSNGLLTTNVTFNGAARDGSDYSDEGIYTFTVSNHYTGESTTKTIYVGNNKYINCLAITKKTVEEINEYISEGAYIDDDGNLVLPNNEVVVPEETEEENVEPEIVEETSEDIQEETESEVEQTDDSVENTTGSVSADAIAKNTPGTKLIIIPVLVVIAIGVVAFCLKNKKNGALRTNKEDTKDTQENEEQKAVTQFITEDEKKEEE